MDGKRTAERGSGPGIGLDSLSVMWAGRLDFPIRGDREVRGLQAVRVFGLRIVIAGIRKADPCALRRAALLAVARGFVGDLLASSACAPAAANWLETRHARGRMGAWKSPPERPVSDVGVWVVNVLVPTKLPPDDARAYWSDHGVSLRLFACWPDHPRQRWERPKSELRVHTGAVPPAAVPLASLQGGFRDRREREGCGRGLRPT